MLKGILTTEMYSNFLYLSVGIRIFLSPNLLNHYLDYAEKLLQYFVASFAKLYGKSQMVYNVHSLVHLHEDAKRYGVLDNISSFPFESYLGRMNLGQYR